MREARWEAANYSALQAAEAVRQVRPLEPVEAEDRRAVFLGEMNIPRDQEELRRDLEEVRAGARTPLARLSIMGTPAEAEGMVQTLVHRTAPEAEEPEGLTITRNSKIRDRTSEVVGEDMAAVEEEEVPIMLNLRVHQGAQVCPASS